VRKIGLAGSLLSITKSALIRFLQIHLLAWNVSHSVVEAERSLLDHLVEMHDQYLTTMWRRARHAFEERHRQLRRRAREGVETVLLAIDILLAPPADGDDVRAQVSQRIGFEHLHEAAQSCREFQRLEERGQLDELCARYTNLRRYLPAFFSLPFVGERAVRS
jgi:hypothetical protein